MKRLLSAEVKGAHNARHPYLPCTEASCYLGFVAPVGSPQGSDGSWVWPPPGVRPALPERGRPSRPSHSRKGPMFQGVSGAMPSCSKWLLIERSRDGACPVLLAWNLEPHELFRRHASTRAVRPWRRRGRYGCPANAKGGPCSFGQPPGSGFLRLLHVRGRTAG